MDMDITSIISLILTGSLLILGVVVGIKVESYDDNKLEK